jgi:hypothetical protein
MFRFLNIPNFILEWFNQLVFPPAVFKGSFFPTSFPTHVFVGVFDDGYSNRGEVEFSVVLICISFMARDGEHFSSVFGHLSFFF